MKITKNEFVETMTRSLTCFAGVTMKPLSRDEVYCKVESLLHPDVFLCVRSCKKRNRDLEFNEGSYLGLHPGSEYSKYAYPGSFVLMITHPGGKTMYYIIRRVDQANWERQS